jgi:hypothetical protein
LTADRHPRDRYVNEFRRLLKALDQRLEGRAWIMGDAYTVVDICTFPWIRNLIGLYRATDRVGIGGVPNVTHALAGFLDAPRRGQVSIHPGRAHGKDIERAQFQVVDGIGSLRSVCDSSANAGFIGN